MTHEMKNLMDADLSESECWPGRWRCTVTSSLPSPGGTG